MYVLRAGTPVYVKTADICSMTGKSNQWIGQLVAQGTLHKRSTPHGSLFDVAEAVRAYCSMLEARAGPAKTEEEIKQEIKQEKAKAAADVTMKIAKANIAKAEADELQGKMHRSEDVAAMTTDLIYAIRGAMMALPGPPGRGRGLSELPSGGRRDHPPRGQQGHAGALQLPL